MYLSIDGISRLYHVAERSYIFSGHTLQYYEGVRAMWLAEKGGEIYKHPYDLGAFDNLTSVRLLSWVFFANKSCYYWAQHNPHICDIGWIVAAIHMIWAEGSGFLISYLFKLFVLFVNLIEYIHWCEFNFSWTWYHMM